MAVDAERLAKMNAARAAKLVDGNTRARGEEKIQLALSWVYRWGWTTPAILDTLVKSRSSLGARMTKAGLLQRTRTKSGGAVRGVPQWILTLTELGLAEAEKHFSTPDELLDYDTDPLRVNQANLRHNVLAQGSTAKNLASGFIVDYKTEAQMADKSLPNQKQPDALWIKKNGDKIAVEVELSAKWSRQLDQFILGCWNGLTENRFTQVWMISDSNAILVRYAEAVEAGASLNIWARDIKSRHWSVERIDKIPAGLKERFKWQKID